MTSPLIAGYVAGLHRELPAAVADEAADGLIETYEHHLAAGTGEQEAARAALAEFGDLATGDRRVHPAGPRPARRPAAAGDRAGRRRLLGGRPDPQPRLDLAGARPPPAQLRRRPAAGGPGARGRRDQPASYQRTRLTAAASPVILVLDATAVTAVTLAAPALTPALGIAMAVSLSRIAFTAWIAAPHRHLTGTHITPPRGLAPQSTAAITTRRPRGPPADRLDRMIEPGPQNRRICADPAERTA